MECPEHLFQVPFLIDPVIHRQREPFDAAKNATGAQLPRKSALIRPRNVESAGACSAAVRFSGESPASPIPAVAGSGVAGTAGVWSAPVVILSTLASVAPGSSASKSLMRRSRFSGGAGGAGGTTMVSAAGLTS